MKVLKKFFAGLVILLIFCGNVSAADVNLPPAIKQAIESRVFISVFEQSKETGLELPRSFGSGFVVSDVYVITASHLFLDESLAFLGALSVKDNLVIKVSRRASEEPTKAEVVAVDFRNDIVLLKVAEPKKIGPPVKFAKIFPSDGETVYFSGFWAGGFNTTLKGVVLGKHNLNYDVFQIEYAAILDRQIPPGFSGGPVFNLKGELVGVNLATDSTAGFGAILTLYPVKNILKTNNIPFN